MVPDVLRKYIPGAPEFIEYTKELPKYTTSQKNVVRHWITNFERAIANSNQYRIIGRQKIDVRGTLYHFSQLNAMAIGLWRIYSPWQAIGLWRGEYINHSRFCSSYSARLYFLRVRLLVVELTPVEIADSSTLIIVLQLTRWRHLFWKSTCTFAKLALDLQSWHP